MDSVFVRLMLGVKMDASTGCWNWIGAKQTGYGAIRLRGRITRKAHRLMYSEIKGAIPDGHQIDHVCRNRACVNPSHLEAVTQAENIRRGNAGLHHAIKAFCPKGHPYFGDNLYVSLTGGKYCKECNKQRKRVRRAKARLSK